MVPPDAYARAWRNQRLRWWSNLAFGISTLLFISAPVALPCPLCPWGAMGALALTAASYVWLISWRCPRCRSVYWLPLVGGESLRDAATADWGEGRDPGRRSPRRAFAT